MGCSAAESEEKLFTPHKWVYSDVRVIDPVDTDHPDQDIIAAYMHDAGDSNVRLILNSYPSTQIDFRLDFLDLDYVPNQDIYLALDHLPGGTHTLPDNTKADIKWDTLIYLPAQGGIEAVDNNQKPRQNLTLRITRDPTLDFISINLLLDQTAAPVSPLLAQVFVTAPGELSTTDQTSQFALDQTPPPPAETLFAFWNVYPAYTPAQALRRWDGAHTGPLGGRHGLYNLLRAARNIEIPLVLLDLKSPARLSALDYSRSLPLVQELNSRGLITLPDVVPFTYPSGSQLAPQISQELIHFAAADSRSTGDLFGLPDSQLLYTPSNTQEIVGYTQHLTLSKTDQPLGQFFRKGQTRWTMIPFSPQLTGEIQQAGRTGPTLLTRQQLVSQALSYSRDPAASVLVLGGDLVATTWGDPQSVRETLRYISAHPWIKPLTAHELSTHSVSPITASYKPAFMENSPVFGSISAKLLPELKNAADDPLVREAWHSYTDLLSPVYPLPDELMTLRSNYAGQIALLLAASRWNTDSRPQSSCDEDLDFDGKLECVLANEHLLGYFDPAEGTLTHLFSRTDSGEIHQWIAPSSQFTTATSDPSLWQLDAGSRADPYAIQGAFAEAGAPFTAQITSNKLVFERTGTIKTYHITGHSLGLEYSSDHSAVLQMPIVVDPWLRFTPDWADAALTDQAEQYITWSIPESANLTVSSDTPLTQHTYRDTRELMGAPENPNYDYPPGHYLLFPVSLITMNASGNVSLSLEIVE